LKNYKEDKDHMSHLVMLNYQIIENNNKEEACISIFEFDEQKNQINPLNFMIVSQNLQKD
jgi:hypothetical protein